MPQHEPVVFGVEETLPLISSILFGIQVLIYNINGPLTAAFLVYQNLCTQPGDEELLVELISGGIFMAGICTLIQIGVGIRLPILQNSSFSFLAVIVSMMKTDRWKCPSPCVDHHNVSFNLSDTDIQVPCAEEAWRPRLLHISGAIVLASCVQVIIGCSGVIGSMVRYIGPLTVSPVITLVGLSLYKSSSSLATSHWPIAAFTSVCFVLMVLVLERVRVPIPSWRRSKGCYFTRSPIFQLYPSLFAIGIPWIVCGVLTATSVLPEDPDNPKYQARTDAKTHLLYDAKWIYFPYPGYYGLPTVGTGVFTGMLAATFASIIESIGDYYATASRCGMAVPPRSALNRGVIAEGLGGILSGLAGTCVATTSYTSTIGFLGFTRVYSRRTWLISAVVMMVAGMCGKVGAALAMVPSPIAGGINICGISILTAVGVSTLHHCDINSMRNLMIFGLSVILGLMVPSYLADTPGLINTGNEDLNQVLEMFLGTGIALGGLIGFILDNIMPGTRKSRGFVTVLADSESQAEKNADKCYDLPFISDWLGRHYVFSYVPFLPSYEHRTPDCFNTSCKERYFTDDNPETEEIGLNGTASIITKNP